MDTCRSCRIYRLAEYGYMQKISALTHPWLMEKAINLKVAFSYHRLCSHFSRVHCLTHNIPPAWFIIEFPMLYTYTLYVVNT